MKKAFTLTLLLLCAFTISARAQASKSDWTFPAPGIKSIYSQELKANVYDLGNGVFAARQNIKGNDFVLVSLPPNISIEDADLALAVVAKVLKLPRYLADTILERANDYEFRFRTLSGRVAGVTLAHDRASAIVRLIPLGEGAAPN
jgi:hypothetical protein